MKQRLIMLLSLSCIWTGAVYPAFAQTVTHPQTSPAALTISARDLVQPLKNPAELGVIRYDTLPTTQQLQADLPRIRQLLSVGSLRYVIALNELSTQASQLRQLIQQTRTARLRAELVLTDLDNSKPTDLSVAIPAGLSLVALERPLTTQGRERFISLYQQLGQNSSLERAILFKQASDLAWLKQAVPTPSRWLLDFQAPIWRLHHQIRRIDALLGHSRWQLNRVSQPEALQVENEYSQAWQLRFSFYFSKKYGLLPAAVSLRKSQTSTGYEAGLLRADDSLKPAFWLTQVYYHVRRIDLDEPKLTTALYETSANELSDEWESAPALPDQPAALTHEFTQALYKVLPRDSMLPYLSSRQSKLFYDFLQLRSEESLLNSHFARLIEAQQTPQANGQRDLQLSFVSALGTFRFNQAFGLVQTSVGWRIGSLSEPLLQPDYDRLELTQQQPDAAMIQLQVSDKLKTETRIYKQPDGSRRLWFRLQNQSRQALDIQPLSLTAADGRVYTPLPVEAPLLRQLAPGEQIESSLVFDGDGPYFFQAQALASEAYAPRALEVQTQIQSGALNITVTNPLIERLLLPVIRIQLKDNKQIYYLRYVLPQALLPLERKIYTVPLPAEFKAFKATDIQALGTSYPIVDLEINLDDAWRSKELGHWPQALLKYEEILRRFELNLKPVRRAQTLKDLFWLQLQLKRETQAWQTLKRIQGLTELPAAERAKIIYEISEWLVQREYYQRALDLLSQARRIQPRDLPLLRLQAYALLRNGNINIALARYQELLQQQPQNTQVLETVAGLQQRLGQYRAALNTLLRLYQLKPRRADQLTIGSLFQRLGEYAPAIQWYRRYLSGGNHLKVMLDVAWLYERLNQPAEALNWYRRALSAGADAEHWLSVVGLERRLKQPARALESFGRYLTRCTNCQGQTWADAAYLARQLDQFSLAETYYQRHLMLTGNADSRQNLAALQRRRGRRDLALQTLRPLGRHCQNCRNLLLELADLARSQGYWREALGYYRRLGSLERLPASLRYDLTFGAIQAGDTALAEQLSANLTNLNAKQSLALNRELAGLYRRQGRPEAAFKLLKTLYLRQSSPQVLEDLLASALDSDQSKQLEPLLAGTPVPAGMSASGHYLLGKWAYSLGDYVEASEHLKTAVRASSKPIGEHYRLLAAAYRALGQNDCAIAWLERADALLSGAEFKPPLPPGCR